MSRILFNYEKNIVTENAEWQTERSHLHFEINFNYVKYLKLLNFFILNRVLTSGITFWTNQLFSGLVTSIWIIFRLLPDEVYVPGGHVQR